MYIKLALKEQSFQKKNQNKTIILIKPETTIFRSVNTTTTQPLPGKIERTLVIVMNCIVYRESIWRVNYPKLK